MSLEAIRHRTFEILEIGPYGSRLNRLVDVFLIVLILANVVAVAAETVPRLQAAYRAYFVAFEVFSVIVFTVEYALRVWVAADDVRHGAGSAASRRWRFVRSPLAVIDLLAILPFYVFFFAAPDLRFLRIFRLVRLFKLARYSPAVAALARVFYDERRALMGALIIMFGLVLVSASVMYFVERQAQPEAFGSIPQATWWALVTLTTVGYGDVVPVTLLGRILGSVVMIFGLAVYAIPIGIIASGFSSEIHRREFMVRWGLIAKVPLFRGLDAETIGDLSHYLKAVVVEAGTVLSRPGQVLHELFFVVSGELSAEIGKHVTTLGEGDFFGEGGLIEDAPARTTITARTSCRLMVLAGHDFKHLLKSRPELAARVGEAAEQRLKQLVEVGEIGAEEAEALFDNLKRWWEPPSGT